MPNQTSKHFRSNQATDFIIQTESSPASGLSSQQRYGAVAGVRGDSSMLGRDRLACLVCRIGRCVELDTSPVRMASQWLFGFFPVPGSWQILRCMKTVGQTVGIWTFGTLCLVGEI